LAFFFTDFFRQQLTANLNLMNAANVRVVLWRTAPSLSGSVTPYLGVRTVADLEAITGWDEVAGIPGYPFNSRSVSVSVRTLAPPDNNSRYVMFSQYPFTDLTLPVGISAIGVQYVGTLAGVVNPLIFVSNTPTGLFQNVYPVDALTAQPDTKFPDSTNRYLFSWAVPTGGAQVQPVEGPLAMFKGPPAYEAANTTHVWLYPQRANMAANPSFELPGTGFWSSNGAITRVAGGAPGAGTWAGQFGGTIAESNIFPTLLGDSDHEEWTIQLMAKGTGDTKIGLVYWDRDYRGTGVDWGTETWTLQPNVWTHIACLRQGFQAHTAMLRIESKAAFTIDQVLVERGYLKDWDYFDGDEKYGAPDSYFWYGGSNRQGASYSMWYSNRRAVMGRLFATDTNVANADAILTDDDVALWGLVYQWVPAGVQVVPHIDVFYPGDLRAPVPPKSAGVIPYRTGPNDTTGVVNPWV
jgi:hypothetical protein